MSDSVEFHRPLDVFRLPADGASRKIAAKAEERAALAKRFGLLTLDRLEAEVAVEPVPGGFYRLTATLQAEVAQECVVTLEPVPQRIDETFTLLYGKAEDAETVLLDSDSDPVEPLDGGIIDLGEAVAQQLSLVLDPFPRAPGVPAEIAPISVEPPEPESPFAVLAKLRKDRST